MESILIGTWSGTSGGQYPEQLIITFAADGAYSAAQTPAVPASEPVHGTYTLFGDQLRVETQPSTNAPSMLIEYLWWQVRDDTLTLRDQHQAEIHLTRIGMQN